jgi:hypothetical protein
MGLFQRLFSGASEPNSSAESERSPDQALSSVRQLTAEIQALKHEIRSLRESLTPIGGGLKTAPGAPALPAHAPEPTPSADSVPEGRTRRRRRGGRNGQGGYREDRGPRPEAAPERPDDGTELRFRDEADPAEFRPRTPRPPPEDAPTGPLVDHLRERGVLVYEGQDDLNRNEAFEHLARDLGAHFDLLSPFYEKLKRLVASGRGSKFEVEHLNDVERSAAVQFGTLLHRHGMLKDFYYHRSPKRALRVIPTKDGKTGQFLTGGWLEIFVSMMLSRRLRAHVSPARCQLLYNVKGALPDGREFEADIMAVVESRMFWLECKTGNWQDYAARFRGLVKIFGVDRNSGGLLLLRAPDASTRSRATDMLEMTLLSLPEVDGYICRFLGVEPGTAPVFETAIGIGTADVFASVGTPELETIEGVTGTDGAEGAEDDEPAESEAPLEHVAPAKRLGRVALPGVPGAGPLVEPASEEGGGRRRRRRRRRGGAGGGETAAGAHLIEPLPIFAEGGAKSADAGTAAEASAEPVAASPRDLAASPPAEGVAGEGEPRRRRRRRRGGRGRGAKPSPFAEGTIPVLFAPLTPSEIAASGEVTDVAVPSEELEEEVVPVAVPVAQPTAVRPAPSAPVQPPQTAAPAAKPLVTPKVGATGATIAPDWRAMVAGGKKKTDEAAD